MNTKTPARTQAINEDEMRDARREYVAADMWRDDRNRDRPAQTRDDLVLWLECINDDYSDD